MSKGLGRLQTEILALMRGESKPQRFASCSCLDTAEVLEEMMSRGMLEKLPRKVAMGAVRRACDGLTRRGLMSCKWVLDLDNPGRKTIQWEVVR